MTVIATDTARLSNLIKKLDAPNNPELFNEVLTVNEAAAVSYPIGTVLGKVTATGKYQISKPGASDGSQVASAIYIGTGTLGSPETLAVAATTDTKVLALVRGKAVVSAGALVLDATVNTTNLKAALYAQLLAVGIAVETTV